MYLQIVEVDVQRAMILAADPADLPMYQSHIIHSPSMIECRLSIEHYPMLKPLHTNSKCHLGPDQE